MKKGDKNAGPVDDGRKAVKQCAKILKHAKLAAEAKGEEARPFDKLMRECRDEFGNPRPTIRLQIDNMFAADRYGERRMGHGHYAALGRTLRKA